MLPGMDLDDVRYPNSQQKRLAPHLSAEMCLLQTESAWCVYLLLDLHGYCGTC